MTTTANYYQVTKHLFEQLPNDSTTCRYCQLSFSDNLHSNVPTQPAPDTGEWHVHKCKRETVNEDGLYVAFVTDEVTAAQIVSDHNAVLRLVEALDLAAKRLDFLTNWIENTYGGTNSDVQLGRSYAEDARATLTTLRKGA